MPPTPRPAPAASSASANASSPGNGPAEEDLRGYDAVACITQQSLNSQLLGLYQLGVIEDSIDEEDENGSVMAALTAPTVDLVVRGAGATQDIVLRIHFGPGELRLAGADKAVDLDGAYLGFRSVVQRLRLDRNALLQSDRATPEFRAAVQAVEPSLDIESLYVCLEETITADHLFTMQGIPSGRALDVLVALCARHFRDGDGPVPRLLLGAHALEGTGGNAAVPSLVPTSVEHGVTLHRTEPDLSTLNFLMMCGGRPAPRPQPYLPVPRVPRGVPGRYLVSERLFFGDGIFAELAATAHAATPAAWEPDANCFVLRGRVPLGHQNRKITGTEVVIDLAAEIEAHIAVEQSGPAIGLNFSWTITNVGTCQADGAPIDLSPIRLDASMRHRWELTQQGRTGMRLKYVFNEPLEYSSNENFDRMYRQEKMLDVPEAFRQACGAFYGGAWFAYRFSEYTLGASRDLNAGAVILPLGRTFFFSNLTTAGEANRNLQADLTYRD